LPLGSRVTHFWVTRGFAHVLVEHREPLGHILLVDPHVMEGLVQ